MKKTYTPNFLSALQTQEIIHKDIGTDFLKSYRKKKNKQKAMSLGMLIIFVFNMTMMGNFFITSPAKAVVLDTEDACAICDGKITILTLRYDGTEASEIKIVDCLQM